MSTCYMWRLTNRLNETATEIEEEKNRAKERYNSRASSTTSGAMKDKSGRNNSVAIEESTSSQQQFKDFDYNTDRAKKAS